MTGGERSLWRAWEKRRDSDSFERLVRPHLRFLADFARRAGCGAEADDAVQTALVELAQARGDRPLRIPLRAWLGRSVLQQARMHRRAMARRARHEAAAARRERVDPPCTAHDEVERALERLAPEARLAVELRFLHDLDYKEIAHILKASEIACRIRVHRAIARLKKELGVLAPAMIAALPLLGGAADARAALARNAAAGAGTILGGGLLMATKLKIAAVAALVLVALFLWRAPGSRPVARAPREDARAAANSPATEERLPPGRPPAASGSEGASGAEDETEPPLSPGNGCVRGLVRFEDGEPLQGARVSLWGESKIYATTDAQGRFHLHDDWVAGRAVYLCGPTGIRGDGAFGFLLGPEVRMVEGETVRVEIVLKRGERVAAQVLSAATGDPVAGAEIELRRWDKDQIASGQASFGYTHADAMGRFAFDHVVPADYSLAISAKGLEAQYAHWDLRERDLPDTFRLENARRLEIRVKNAPAIAVGTEVRWCLRLSHSKDGKVPRQEFFMLDGEAVMQEGGLLVGDAPPTGRYDLTLWPTDVLPQVEREEIALGSAPVETLTVEIPAGVRVEGSVRWPDGSPIEGARVLAGGLSRETDADGRYAFAWLPGAGSAAEFRIRLGGAEFPMGERMLDLTGPRVLDFALPGSGSVRFELKDVAADKFGGIEVRRAGETEPVVERRIDRPPAGAIVLRGLPPGPLRLDVWQLDRSWIRREIRVDGETLDLGVIEFPDWPRPEIQVRVPAGKAMPAWIFLWQEDGPPVGTRRVELDKDGRGSLPPQPAGPRRVFLRGPFGAPVEVEFTVDPERPRPLEVLLDPG